MKICFDLKYPTLLYFNPKAWLKKRIITKLSSNFWSILRSSSTFHFNQRLNFSIILWLKIWTVLNKGTIQSVFLKHDFEDWNSIIRACLILKLGSKEIMQGLILNDVSTQFVRICRRRRSPFARYPKIPTM